MASLDKNNAPTFIHRFTARVARVGCDSARSFVSDSPLVADLNSGFCLDIANETIPIPNDCVVQKRARTGWYHLAESVTIERYDKKFRITSHDNRQPEYVLIFLRSMNGCRVKFQTRLTDEQLLLRCRLRPAEYLLLLKPSDEVQITTRGNRKKSTETITVSDDLTISIRKLEKLAPPKNPEPKWTNAKTGCTTSQAVAPARRSQRELQPTYSTHPLLSEIQRKLVEELNQQNKKQRVEDAITFLLPVVNALQALYGNVRNNLSLEAVAETLTRAEVHYTAVVWTEEKQALRLVRESFDYLRWVLKQWVDDTEPQHAAELIEQMAALAADPIRTLGHEEVVAGVPFIESDCVSTA